MGSTEGAACKMSGQRASMQLRQRLVQVHQQAVAQAASTAQGLLSAQ